MRLNSLKQHVQAPSAEEKFLKIRSDSNLQLKINVHQKGKPFLINGTLVISEIICSSYLLYYRYYTFILFCFSAYACILLYDCALIHYISNVQVKLLYIKFLHCWWMHVKSKRCLNIITQSIYYECIMYEFMNVIWKYKF